MKKLLYLIAFATLVCTSHAQTFQYQPLQLNAPAVKKWRPQIIDTALKYNNLLLPQKQQPVGSMPNAYIPSIQLTYKGNNGNGLDIYQANIDNMYVLKPDATFYAPGAVIKENSKQSQAQVVP